MERRVDFGTKTYSIRNFNAATVECHPSFPRAVDYPAPLKGPGNRSDQTFFSSRCRGLVGAARRALALLLLAGAGAGLLLLLTAALLLVAVALLLLGRLTGLLTGLLGGVLAHGTLRRWLLCLCRSSPAKTKRPHQASSFTEGHAKNLTAGRISCQ